MTPKFATVRNWCALSGMGRTAVFEALKDEHLKAVRNGRRVLIDVDAGLAWLASRPRKPVTSQPLEQDSKSAVVRSSPPTFAQ